MKIKQTFSVQGKNYLHCTYILYFEVHLNFQPIRLLDPSSLYKFKYLMTNSADPDQLASSEAS